LTSGGALAILWWQRARSRCRIAFLYLKVSKKPLVMKSVAFNLLKEAL
jgi:hypothetical protein